MPSQSPSDFIKIRMATTADAEQILAIYAPFIEQSIISFEYSVPSLEEFKARIEAYLSFAPWLVATTDERILGYAYASKYRAREAYSWAVETSVYLAPDAKGQGLGAWLYDELFKILIASGYSQALAGIALPNEASVKHHEKMGFELIGVYPKIGFKLGAWHDVGWYRKELVPIDGTPNPIRHYKEL